MGTSEAREVAFAAHAARDADQAAGRFAARAAGHSAATAHVAGHAGHAATYAVKAVTASDDATAAEEERNWQFGRLPERLRPVALPNYD